MIRVFLCCQKNIRRRKVQIKIKNKETSFPRKKSSKKLEKKTADKKIICNTMNNLDFDWKIFNIENSMKIEKYKLKII